MKSNYIDRINIGLSIEGERSLVLNNTGGIGVKVSNNNMELTKDTTNKNKEGKVLKSIGNIIDKVNVENEERRNLSIIYLNARSIINKIDELRILAREHKPDIIGVVETWLNENIYDREVEIDDYCIIRKDRINDNKLVGGGIVIYVQKDISCLNVTEEYCSNIDHLWIKLIGKNCRQINLGIFYRPPDSNDEQMKFLLRNMSRFKTSNTILMGDFNYRDINWRNNTSGSNGNKFLNFVSKLDLKQCVKDKTRGGNILDLILVHDKAMINKVDIMTPLGKSDHNVIKVILNVAMKTVKKSITCFNYKKGNYELLEKKIAKIDWENLVQTNSVNYVWEFIRNMLTNFKENHIPNYKRNITNDVPWFNNTVRKFIKKKK